MRVPAAPAWHLGQSLGLSGSTSLQCNGPLFPYLWVPASAPSSFPWCLGLAPGCARYSRKDDFLHVVDHLLSYHNDQQLLGKFDETATRATLHETTRTGWHQSGGWKLGSPQLGNDVSRGSGWLHPDLDLPLPWEKPLLTCMESWLDRPPSTSLLYRGYI